MLPWLSVIYGDLHTKPRPITCLTVLCRLLGSLSRPCHIGRQMPLAVQDASSNSREIVHFMVGRHERQKGRECCVVIPGCLETRRWMRCADHGCGNWSHWTVSRASRRRRRRRCHDLICYVPRPLTRAVMSAIHDYSHRWYHRCNGISDLVKQEVCLENDNIFIIHQK